MHTDCKAWPGTCRTAGCENGPAENTWVAESITIAENLGLRGDLEYCERCLAVMFEERKLHRARVGELLLEKMRAWNEGYEAALGAIESGATVRDLRRIVR